mmetsp:Transcript_25739/g.60354  ORF Transcript_25739/g.60354 Transcript_25739/m.60354 type:complete len:332 (-) Transcript_25739:339-1334(-)|eukprot:CAMPEP_0197186626 /NCGR_PEP_ID=MMETSP1423-20130617/14279_1 /TAXON_ID=476441 /ORGANISM="Pseudo-nitzschia heimii, Strain UNC1101" /LENGTH=331 /DNA_ID=CAMNT_0042637991 /DNA_START=24 /DNA_END=1019 /DNA_ORIENTATION=-
MNLSRSPLFYAVLLLGSSDAWMTPLVDNKPPLPHMQGRTTRAPSVGDVSTTLFAANNNDDDPKQLSSGITDPGFDSQQGGIATATAASFMVLAALAAVPEGASAAVVPAEIPSTVASASSTILTAGGSISSALFAYGHYFSVIGIVAILMTERLTLENGPDLSDGEETRLAVADILYGVTGVLLLYTGYCRANDPALGKGINFYLHEPVFWLKMAMVGVLGACSLFNTTKIIQRSVARFTAGDDEPVEPMSQALCDRMKSVCNAQLTGIVFIPMAATFMARGIGYNESIPWQAEAAGVALVFGGLAFKYVREALTFEARLLDAERKTMVLK